MAEILDPARIGKLKARASPKKAMQTDEGKSQKN